VYQLAFPRSICQGAPISDLGYSDQQLIVRLFSDVSQRAECNKSKHNCERAKSRLFLLEIQHRNFYFQICIKCTVWKVSNCDCREDYGILGHDEMLLVIKIPKLLRNMLISSSR
jgi:hypothetical protein